MRAVLLTQEAHRRNPSFISADVARTVVDRWGGSLANDKRVVAIAIDVLGIHYVPLNHRRPRPKLGSTTP